MKDCIEFEKRMIHEDNLYEESNQIKNDCESLIYLYKEKIYGNLKDLIEENLKPMLNENLEKCLDWL